MNTEKYMEASERTEVKFPEGMTLNGDVQTIFSHLTDDITSVAESMDHIKKHLIYGAENNIRVNQSTFKRRDKVLDQKKAELLHAAIGKVTEAVEFYEAVANHVFSSKDLDEANLFEEIGDCFWYDAMALRILGKSFEDAMQTNIDKLTKRYPDKFTKHAALNRDLDSERKILDDGMSGIEKIAQSGLKAGQLEVYTGGLNVGKSSLNDKAETVE